MYTRINFKSKKALKEAVKNGEDVWVYQPNDLFGVGGQINHGTHRVCLEGPHYPKPHSWDASVEVVDGLVKRVIS